MQVTGAVHCNRCSACWDTDASTLELHHSRHRLCRQIAKLNGQRPSDGVARGHAGGHIIILQCTRTFSILAPKVLDKYYLIGLTMILCHWPTNDSTWWGNLLQISGKRFRLDIEEQDMTLWVSCCLFATCALAACFPALQVQVRTEVN
eukprot:1152352-Pelagomonas_calceolata.AAC.1